MLLWTFAIFNSSWHWQRKGSSYELGVSFDTNHWRVRDTSIVAGKRRQKSYSSKGFQDPDLLRINSNSPTVSTLGRNLSTSSETSHFGWETVSRRRQNGLFKQRRHGTASHYFWWPSRRCEDLSWHVKRSRFQNQKSYQWTVECSKTVAEQTGQGT